MEIAKQNLQKSNEYDYNMMLLIKEKRKDFNHWFH